MKKPKNSVELPNPTRNNRKFATKLMSDTSGKINLQSKKDIICHIAEVKSATSAHYVADVIPVLACHYFSLESNALKKLKKRISHTIKS